MDYKSKLNDRQFEAVSSSSQYLRIIAGAGSGKTRVLTYRIAYLISECGMDPDSILAIAFTRKVANEMNERAAKIVKEVTGSTPRLHISTFHALCAEFLRIEHRAIGYPIGYTIYDEKDQEKLIKTCAADLGYKKGDAIVKDVVKFIRNKKARGIYPDAIGKSMNSSDEVAVKIFKTYEERKTDCFALDFDDLMLKTIEVLENDPSIRERWCHRYEHILIDEFQDTNDIQFKLLKLLTNPGTSLTVVGDPDQTIYTWRGANQKLIMRFSDSFPNAETVVLDENYRSTKNILDAANKLIAHNKNREPKNLFTSGERGEPIETFCGYNAYKEADWVAKRIVGIADRHRNECGDPDYSEIAILYRSAYLTRPFEEAMKDRGIQYRIFGGVRFYERAEVKDLLAYFNLLVNPLDNVAFERIVNVPRRKIGDASVERLRTEALKQKMSEYEYVSRIDEFMDSTEVPTRALASLKMLVDSMERTKSRLTDNLEAYSGILMDFVKEIGYFDYVKEQEEADEDRVGNVNALFDDITHFINNHPDADFSEYLHNVSVLSSQDDLNDGNYVSFMTIHVAKGLEFPYVFIIGMNDGSFPSSRSLAETDRDGEEEERRLAYVAMTRAKKKLFCSCNNGYSYTSDGRATPSPYFKEAGLFVKESDFYDNSANGKGYGFSQKPKKRNDDWTFWNDDDYDPFESQTPKETPKPAKVVETSNGITDWMIGEECIHDKFGKGKIIQKIGDNIVMVDFETEGKKTLMANHPMLKRAVSKGGKA